MEKLSKLFRWVDDNIIRILIVGYIFIIPLFPKIPIKMISYTYIAIRMEDFYTAALLGIFILQFLRKKVVLNKRFFKIFLIYWLAVFLSLLYGFFVAHNLPYKQLSFLNALRRIEYMAPFFVAIACITSKKDLYKFLDLVLLALFIVGVYGIGQKFLGWPAVQTMNPEYAKGYLLYLTPEARVSSTFAGHYDLAAYLVFLMPLSLAFYFFRKRFYYFLLFTLSLLVLVFTASRASYGAYVLSTFPFLLYLRKYKLLVIVIILTAIFTLSSNNLTSRFKRTFQVKQIFVNQNTGQVVVPQQYSVKELPAGTFYIGLQAKPGGTSTVQTRDLLTQNLIDEARSAAKSKGEVLTEAQLAAITASIEANLKPINTVVSDISFATRLQVEWPRAIKAFLKSPIFGTGPASVTESTDNDYLRSLAEFGLLGTISFAWIFFSISRFIYKAIGKVEKAEAPVYLAFLFGLLGLFINASYIDVFEASKIAFHFWTIAGLYVGALSL